jgi:hypothetical protein
MVLTVDEQRGQTRAIHDQQRVRHMLSGMLADAQRQACCHLHHNAQRLLKPIRVNNPYADQLTFVDHRTRNRRDNEAYLTLIDAVTLLHQYQRRRRTIELDGVPVAYIETTLEDIGVANWLAHEILGSSIDELQPQTRKLLLLIDAMVDRRCGERGIDRRAYRFTRRDVREFTLWGNTQLKTHLCRLEDMEYLIVHRGGGRGRWIQYELHYDSQGAQGARRMAGLVNPSELQPPLDQEPNLAGQREQKSAQKSARKCRKSALGRSGVGAVSPGRRGDPIVASHTDTTGSE